MSDLSNLPISQNLIAGLLNERNSFAKVYDLSGRYNVVDRIIQNMNPSGPKKVETDVYEFSKIGNLNVATQISAVTVPAQTGTGLTITFADLGYGNFRVGDIVQDINGVQGRVESKGSGTIVVTPWAIGALTAGTHFVAGTTIRRIGDASATNSSKGKESLYIKADTDYNYLQVMRNSLYLSRRDMTLKTKIMYEGKYWWSAQDAEVVNNLSREIELTTIFGKRNRANTTHGEVDTNGGIIWSIDNRGGTHIVSPSVLTETMLQDYIATVVRKSAGRSREFTLFYGIDCLGVLQNFLSSKYLVNTGTSNTFGGSAVKGLDVMEYSFLGSKIKFVPLPLFDDPIIFGGEISNISGKARMSSSFLLMDTSPINAFDSGTLPAIEQLYRGEKEMYYGYIPGMVGVNGESPSSYIQMGKNLMASDVDGVSCHALTDRGINIADAKNMLFWELAE